MKELARILIHFPKIYSCGASFKMLLSMCLEIVDKEPLIYLWSSYLQTALSKK